ncbi:60S ribosomal protein eL22 [Dipodascopsis tothii]|uniref:60S ribosomal protein eL22 n=1 Tax=Dipodascopsis tothii TaxID=44089 RepID=UPI0034CFD15C
MAPKTTKKAAKVTQKFTIGTSAASTIFDSEKFVTFLHNKIKVDGRTGNLGDNITIAAEGDKIVIVSHIPLSGRYLKYLTKKYLKKSSLRDWLRVVSTSKGNYELKYFNVVVSDDEEEEDEE